MSACDFYFSSTNFLTQMRLDFSVPAQFKTVPEYEMQRRTAASWFSMAQSHATYLSLRWWLFVLKGAWWELRSSYVEHAHPERTRTIPRDGLSIALITGVTT